jgi:uncharacterized protein YsxB (DUF464 family)
VVIRLTKATFTKLGKKFIAFKIEGHSGYAPIGSDIVCAGISTASHMVVTGLAEGYRLPINVEERPGFLECDIKGLKYFDIIKAQCWFKTLFWTLEDISKQYPENLQIETIEMDLEGGNEDGNSN